MKNYLAVLSAILFIAGYVPYVLAVLRKQTKPSKASWLIWATLDAVIFAGMLAEGRLSGQMTGALTGSWIVTALAFYYGQPGWTRIDLACLAGAVLGIALWFIYDSPITGILIGLAVSCLGTIPTLRSAWEDPERENRTAWTLFWLSCVAAILAMPAWTLVDSAQPIAFFMVQSLMMTILFCRRPAPAVAE